MFFNQFTRGISEEPEFTVRRMVDINPLGGTKKIRWIHEPNKAMRKVHARFLQYLRRLQKIHDTLCWHATACRDGNSSRHNVLRHRKNRYFYLVDLHSAYKYVDCGRLADILCCLDKKLTKGIELVQFLQRYCMTGHGGLATGAPCSQDLFNLYTAYLIDRNLKEFCDKHRITYTRYLDDLTFSHPSRRIGKRKRAQIREVIENAGFEISHRKAGVYDLRKGAIEICGIGLAYGGRMFLPRHYLRKIRGLIHRAMTKGDVSLNQVSGHMGVFWSNTDRNRLNQTERNLVNKYHEYMGQLRS